MPRIFYGKSMSEPLPYKDLQFNNNVSLDDILNTADDDETGYILGVDLSFPEHIHEKLREFPPCPENTEKKRRMAE